MRYIIWDWNGTLLDDMDVCIACMNEVLEKHEINKLTGKEDYKSKFAFPIIEYYRNLGFDFQRTPFSLLANEFISLYQPQSLNCSLVAHAETIIETIYHKGISQIVLSASKQENLTDQVKTYRIWKYFTEVLGVNDIYARSKIDIGKNWIRENSISPSDILLIGDTRHDYEVARALNCECLLFTNGHQHIDRNEHKNAKFIEDLMEIENYI